MDRSLPAGSADVSELRRYEVIDDALRVVLVGPSVESLEPARPGTVLAPSLAPLIRSVLEGHDFAKGPAISIERRHYRVCVVRLAGHDGKPYYGIATERIGSTAVPIEAAGERLAEIQVM